MRYDKQLSNERISGVSLCRTVKKVAFSVGLLLALLLAWIFRPYGQTDVSQVDPRVRAIEEPCQKVEVYFFGDGGSIGIKIVDRAGKILNLCLPAPMDEPTFQFKKLFLGALYYSEKGAEEVSPPQHTRRRLAAILRSMSEIDGDIDVAVYRLSGRWRDLWRYIRREHIFDVYEHAAPARKIEDRLNDALAEPDK